VKKKRELTASSSKKSHPGKKIESDGKGRGKSIKGDEGHTFDFLQRGKMPMLQTIKTPKKTVRGRGST